MGDNEDKPENKLEDSPEVAAVASDNGNKTENKEDSPEAAASDDSSDHVALLPKKRKYTHSDNDENFNSPNVHISRSPRVPEFRGKKYRYFSPKGPKTPDGPSPRTPKGPRTPEGPCPETPKTPRSPKGPRTPDGPYPETPKGPRIPKGPRTPDGPCPETPESQKIPKGPRTPDGPCPETPKTPKIVTRSSRLQKYIKNYNKKLPLKKRILLDQNRDEPTTSTARFFSRSSSSSATSCTVTRAPLNYTPCASLNLNSSIHEKFTGKFRSSFIMISAKLQSKKKVIKLIEKTNLKIHGIIPRGDDDDDDSSSSSSDSDGAAGAAAAAAAEEDKNKLENAKKKFRPISPSKWVYSTPPHSGIEPIEPAEGNLLPVLCINDIEPLWQGDVNDLFKFPMIFLDELQEDNPDFPEVGDVEVEVVTDETAADSSNITDEESSAADAFLESVYNQIKNKKM